MMHSGLQDALNDSIDRLNAGAGIADCVQSWPQYATELGSLLAAGQLVRQALPDAREAAAAQARQQLRFERVLAEPVRHRSTMGRARLSWLVASLLLLVLLAGGMGLLAQNSLPGDALYPVKLFTEDLRLVVAADSQGLQDEFAARRFDEARQLVQLQRPAELTLTGTVDVVTTESLTMQDLTLMLPDHDVLPGSRVRVQVRSTNTGTLVVRELRILEAPEPARESPVVIPESTATRPQPTNTPRPTDRPRPTRTVEPRPTDSPGSRAASSTPEFARNAEDECPAAPADWTTYTIEAGDTLSGLAVATGSSVDDLLAANCLTDARHIVAGQALSVPRQPQRRSTAAPTPGAIDTTPVRGVDEVIRPAEQNRQRSEEGEGQQRETSPQRDTDEGEREQRGR